jgi:hypothetical protein
MGLGRLNPGCQTFDPCEACEPVACCDARRVRITFSGLSGCLSSLNGDYTLVLRKHPPQLDCCYVSELTASYSADFFDPRNCIPQTGLTASCEGWTVPPGVLGGSCGGNSGGIPVFGGYTIKYNPKDSNGYSSCSGVPWTHLSVEWYLYCFSCGPSGIGSFTNACGTPRRVGFCSPEARHTSGFRWFTGQSCYSGDLGSGIPFGFGQISNTPTASVVLEL